MTAARRFIGMFRDSPTFGQDRANLVSGFTIGIAGLVLNSIVLIMLLPLMVDPNGYVLRQVTQNMEFGQLRALILLGGASAFATFLIPLRLVSVFWGPRTGRYFDQIVLSGINPVRYVMGKATSQNLFLALILFLLLPWLVLCLTLGGVNPVSFLAGLFLLWLYCMALALVTLWASLYFNDLLAAAMVIGSAAFLSILGCIPFPDQPFVLTPFPALVQPIYESMPSWSGGVSTGFFEMFLWCATAMTGAACVALFGIYLGPLYGIIRENSTFGEVIRSGDSGRKRRFRNRPHIQRSSEMAFFYENCSRTVRRWEGLIRWGLGFCLLLLLSGGATWSLVDSAATQAAWDAPN